MQIQYKNIHDKLEVLGHLFDTSKGWDYAIPQEWCDQLIRMGIDNPGAWFAADCTAITPQLHHVGEALYHILEQRSKANTELFWQLSHEFMDYPKETPEKQLLGVLIEYAGNAVFDDCDAGFTNLQFLVDLFNEGWARGRNAFATETRHISASSGDTAKYEIVYGDYTGPGKWQSSTIIEARDFVDASQQAQDFIKDKSATISTICLVKLS